MDIISVLLMSAKKMLKPCRRKEANVLKKVYEEERLLKKKIGGSNSFFTSYSA